MPQETATTSNDPDISFETWSSRTCPDTRPSAVAPVREDDALYSLRRELVERFAELPAAMVAEVVDRCHAQHSAALNRFYVPALVHGEAVRELVQRRRNAQRVRPFSPTNLDGESWLKE